MHAFFTRNVAVFCLCFCWIAGGHGQALATSASKGVVPAEDATLPQMQRMVAEASAHGVPWSGPESGPPGRPNATIAIVAEDLHNGGILGVAQGVKEAADVLGWHVKVYDDTGTPSGRREAAAAALASNLDGLLLIGADAKDMQALLMPFAARNIPIVGWHVAPVAGPVPGSPVMMNVSTNPLDVARITAMAAVVQSQGHAGVVIFTDAQFGIAKAKSNEMARVIRACKGCSLLEVRDVAISKSAQQMPAVMKDLLGHYRSKWTHALAINDIYFDYATPELTKTGHPSNSLSMLSAGDGSPAAFLRIRAGIFQTGTVAEPLNLHGWQLVDEMNRLLSHQPVTGYIFPVHLVTAANIAFDGGPQMRYDPDNGYRDVYRRIWKR